MGVEIDVLSIGERDGGCGDAIAIRLTEPGRSWVVVVDGGYSDNGKGLVDHLNTQLGTNQVDLLISTHPDSDHCAGLCMVLEGMAVGQVWMHQPWRYSAIASLFHDGRIKPGRVREKLRQSLEAARSLDSLCRRKGIVPIEPFAGLKYGTALTVLGPTQDYYAGLVADFACLPRLAASPNPATTLTRRSVNTPPFRSMPPQTLARGAFDKWYSDNLSNRPHDVSPENNSSVVLWLSWGGYQALLTADVGVHGLARALVYGMENLALDPRHLNLVQVPHHGSRHNVSSAVLNCLLGPITGSSGAQRLAFVSAPRAGGPKHPSKRVMNAFWRRGAPVIWNQNYPAMRIHHNVPSMAGPSLRVQSFHEQVEEVED